MTTLLTTSMRRDASPTTHNEGSPLRVRAMPTSPAIGDSSSITASTTGARSVGTGSTVSPALPSSAMVSRSSTSFSSRSALRRTISSSRAAWPLMAGSPMSTRISV